MNAHQLDENGFILNTIVVDSLDVFPNLVNAGMGGNIGDQIVDGIVIPTVTSPSVPTEVTMRQARLALLGAGLLESIQPVIDSLDSPHKEAAQIEWDYSSTVQRNKQLTGLVGEGLGLTDEQIDDLFIEAVGL